MSAFFLSVSFLEQMPICLGGISAIYLPKFGTCLTPTLARNNRVYTVIIISQFSLQKEMCCSILPFLTISDTGGHVGFVIGRRNLRDHKRELN